MSRRGLSSPRPSTARSVQAADPTGALRRAGKAYGHQLTFGAREAEKVLNTAVKVNDWKVVEDTVDDRPQPTTMRRVLVKQVEVPVVRQVKVPVKTKGIRRVKRQQRVKVKRLVEVPSFKEVEEEYTEVHHRKVMRDKEVWVKKIVQEEVDEPYEVTKTRTKKVPTTSLKEVEQWQTVDVDEDEAVSVDGYRVDDVEDTKLVEVQEEQIYEMVPRPVETHLLGGVDLGLTRHQHIGRHLGERTYTEVEVADVPLDEFPSDKEVVPAMVAHLRQRLGMVISQLSSEHRGVRVKLVRSSYPAERAGLRPGDVITHVDGVPTHTLDVFREVVYTSGKTLTFTVLRRSRTLKISVTKRGEVTATTLRSTRRAVSSPRRPMSPRSPRPASRGGLSVSGASYTANEVRTSGNNNFSSRYRSSSYRYTSN